ncbi:MAG: site-2 protease family protein [Candidatus Nomurabacteria bacterium]|jgi:Zn-dependent protease|nr:site-2 protease family protein [Candidatus Nomurabacteria bacterium]
MNMELLPVYLFFILLSAIAHEFMHGYAAYLLGDDTAKVHGRLSFNPLKHIDPFLSVLLPMLIAVTNMLSGVAMPIFGGAKPVPFNPNKVRWGEWGVALVAIAGPLTNLLLAFVFTGVLFAASASGFWGDVLQIGILVNMGFFAFNVLPIPPLDGSRVLYAVAPQFVRRIMEQMERYGLIIVFILLMLFSEQIGMVIGSIIQFFLKLFILVFS